MVDALFNLFGIGCLGMALDSGATDPGDACDAAFDELGGIDEVKQTLLRAFVETFDETQLDSMAVRTIQVLRGEPENALMLSDTLAAYHAMAIAALEQEFTGAIGDALSSVMSPGATAVLVKHAERCIDEELYDSAVAVCTRALERDSTDLDVLFVRGKALKYAGDYEHAVADFTRLEELAPGETSALEWRAYCLESLGRISEAAADFRAAAQLRLEDASAKLDTIMADVLRKKAEELEGKAK